MDLARYISTGLTNLDFKVGNLTFSPNIYQAGAFVVLLFILILLIAQMRRHFINWSVKGAIFGIFFGFLLALILEGFLVIGGRTALTQVLGWKDPPAPLANLVDAGRNKLVDVLGVTDQVPTSTAAENPTVDEAIQIFQSLDPSESKKAKSLICEP